MHSFELRAPRRTPNTYGVLAKLGSRDRECDLQATQMALRNRTEGEPGVNCRLGLGAGMKGEAHAKRDITCSEHEQHPHVHIPVLLLAIVVACSLIRRRQVG